MSPRRKLTGSDSVPEGGACWSFRCSAPPPQGVCPCACPRRVPFSPALLPLLFPSIGVGGPSVVPCA